MDNQLSEQQIITEFQLRLRQALYSWLAFFAYALFFLFSNDYELQHSVAALSLMAVLLVVVAVTTWRYQCPACGYGKQAIFFIRRYTIPSIVKHGRCAKCGVRLEKAAVVEAIPKGSIPASSFSIGSTPASSTPPVSSGRHIVSGVILGIVAAGLWWLFILLLSVGHFPDQEKRVAVMLLTLIGSFALFFTLIAWALIFRETSELFSVKGWRLISATFLGIAITASILAEHWLAGVLPGLIGVFCLLKEPRVQQILAKSYGLDKME